MAHQTGGSFFGTPHGEPYGAEYAHVHDDDDGESLEAQRLLLEPALVVSCLRLLHPSLQHALLTYVVYDVDVHHHWKFESGWLDCSPLPCWRNSLARTLHHPQFWVAEMN